MAAKTRQIDKTLTKSHSSNKENLLVSGCSYTWNNSEDHACTWPYYLYHMSDLVNVFDCSQSGAGNNHIFNSVINELTTNATISPENTFIIVMWSGLERVDWLADTKLVSSYFHLEPYQFTEDNNYSSLSAWAHGFPQKSNKQVVDLIKQYRSLIDYNGQVLESCLKIIALYHYLHDLGYQFEFVSWKDPDRTIETLRSSNSVINQALDLISTVESLDCWTTNHGNRVPNDGHPTSDSHLGWTREILFPYLTEKNFFKQDL